MPARSAGVAKLPAGKRATPPPLPRDIQEIKAAVRPDSVSGEVFVEDETTQVETREFTGPRALAALH